MSMTRRGMPFTRAPRLEGRLEQAREIGRGLLQRSSRLCLCRGMPIQRRWAGPRSTHPYKHAPDTLHVSDDRSNRTAAPGWRVGKPDARRQHLDKVLAHAATASECLE